MKRAFFVIAIAATSLILPKMSSAAFGQSGANPQSGEAVWATLLEEEPGNRYGNHVAATARWSLQKRVGSGLESETQVDIDVQIPARRLTVSLTISANLDRALPVSHLINIKFDVPSDFQHSGISDVRGIMMKQTEQVVGVPLQGHMVKVLPNVFALGLLQTNVQSNAELLYGRSWLEIAIVFANGRRALLVLEKGRSGDAALTQAFASWSQLDPQVAQVISRIDDQRRSQEMRPQAGENERQREMHAGEALKDKFSSLYGVKEWTDDRALSRNPFVFKNDVVALVTVFSKMLSEDEALFVHNEPVIVSGVPSTLFRNSEHSVLAMRVLGNKTLKLLSGETTASFGQYVGVYKCERPGCAEVYGP